MAWLDKLNHPEEYVKTFFKWGLLGILMGAIGGALGAVFHHALHFVTHLRAENTWLIFLLPLGGVLTVLTYQVLKLQSNKGTNEVIEAALEGKKVNPLVAVAIFLSAPCWNDWGMPMCGSCRSRSCRTGTFPRCVPRIRRIGLRWRSASGRRKCAVRISCWAPIRMVTA